MCSTGRLSSSRTGGGGSQEGGRQRTQPHQHGHQRGRAPNHQEGGAQDSSLRLPLATVARGSLRPGTTQPQWQAGPGPLRHTDEPQARPSGWRMEWRGGRRRKRSSLLRTKGWPRSEICPDCPQPHVEQARPGRKRPETYRVMSFDHGQMTIGGRTMVK